MNLLKTICLQNRLTELLTPSTGLFLLLIASHEVSHILSLQLAMKKIILLIRNQTRNLQLIILFAIWYWIR